MRICALNGNSERKEEKKPVDNWKGQLKLRVRSWLRMNAGGVLNTCKSNGDYTLMRFRSNLV